MSMGCLCPTETVNFLKGEPFLIQKHVATDSDKIILSRAWGKNTGEGTHYLINNEINYRLSFHLDHIPSLHLAQDLGQIWSVKTLRALH